MLECSGKPLNNASKMPNAAKNLASWLFVNKDRLPFTAASKGGVEAFLQRQEAPVSSPGLEEPANILRCTKKIFKVIVMAFRRYEGAVELDFGSGGDGGSSNVNLNFGTVPQPPSPPLPAALDARSTLYLKELPCRVGGIGESADSRYALRMGGIVIMKNAMCLAEAAEEWAKVEQPSLLCRRSDNIPRGNEMMHGPAELAEAIRAVGRSLQSAKLRDDVQLPIQEATPEGCIVAGLCRDGVGGRAALPLPELVHGSQYGLPACAIADPIGWKMHGAFPTSVDRGKHMEVRFHPGFIFDVQQLPAQAPQAPQVPGQLEMHVRCLFRDQTEEWVIPEPSDHSLCFTKHSSKAPRVSLEEVQRARSMYR